MSKRLHPYRQLPPAWITKILGAMPTLYLVGVTGYTSFILQDLQNRKYKITIGNELKCSCAPKLSDHCAHTLYVLKEIFSIDEVDPLIWQNSYLNTQLRFMMANRRIKLNKISEFLKYVSPTYLRRNNIIMEEDQEDDDNLCAICQQQIVRFDTITTCSKMCRNSFHLSCFKQWAEHQARTNSKITCPLCRDDYNNENNRLIMELRKQESQQKHQQATKKVGVAYNYYCQGCELAEIQQGEDVYKCAVCEDIILCTACFNFNRHIRHSFIVKREGNKKWTYAEDRQQKRKLDEQQKLIRVKLTESKFYNFLACTLPCYFSKNTRWNILECKRLEIKMDDLECIMCDDKQRAFLRRLYCGHFIHHKCLKRRIQKGKLFCKIDGEKYLLGYESLIKHEKLNKIIQKEPLKCMPLVKDDPKDEIEQEIMIEQSQDKKKLKTEKSSSLDEKDSSRMKNRKMSASNKKKLSNAELLNRSFNPE